MIINTARRGRSSHFKGVKADGGTFRGQPAAKAGFLRLAAPTAATPIGKQNSSWLLFRLFSALIVIALIGALVSGCRVERKAPQSKGGLLDRPYDENIDVPSGDPEFPHLGEHWVVDPDGLVGASAVCMADETLDDLKFQRIAEVVIVVQKRVKHPVEWSTHYGRWLRLGEAEGSHQNNGIVFLIIPDATGEQGKVWYSIGRGLPKLTSSDMGPLLEEAASYANANDLDGAVISIARNIHDILRRIYGRGE
jgi:hypothetical protein